MSGTSILVTGAGGFIGGHLVARLIRQGHRVRAVDVKPPDEWYQWHSEAESLRLDLTGIDACRQACRGMEHVYQLAADMGGIGYIETHKARCMLSVLINTHMLMAATDAGVQRFFFASSACVYNAEKQSRPDVRPLKESDAYPAMPEDGYGWEKLFSERMCRHFCEDFGLPTAAARYHNVYGPYGTWDGGREKAPAAICRKVIHAVVGGSREIEIWGNGRQTRSFMYIDDCIEGTRRIQAINRDGGVAPVNLGSDELVTIDQLVDLVEEIAGVTLRRRYRPGAPMGVNGRNSDNTRLRELLGWEPSVRLREGLERTYRWIYDQYVGAHGPSDTAPLGRRFLCTDAL